MSHCKPKDYEARVVRAYSLPVGAFDHLKNLQRHLQRTIDPTGERHTVTNSEALTELLNDHYRLGVVAGFKDRTTSELCRDLANGTLVVVPAPREGSLA
ncbi:hypothetical protein BN948_05060 [Hydrogenophaga intermedia]|uniref:Uncharacterized protein n=1 Tax=Hydrogenophaga intermedia TaxID=65786 RepID=A0A1L1PZE2_HYDIT|nr:hypothetical protein BN948_05060 [Hydrogenophaga intermedia]